MHVTLYQITSTINFTDRETMHTGQGCRRGDSDLGQTENLLKLSAIS